MTVEIRVPRVMLDANVLIAAFCYPRGAHELLARARAGELRLVLCPYVLAEARRMIGRAFPRRREAFDAMLAATPYELAADAPPEAVAAHRGLVEDPADVPVALAAVQAGVDALVSSDRHLIGPGAASLQATLRTMSVHDCLRELLALGEPELSALRARTTWPTRPAGPPDAGQDA